MYVDWINPEGIFTSCKQVPEETIAQKIFPKHGKAIEVCSIAFVYRKIGQRNERQERIKCGRCVLMRLILVAEGKDFAFRMFLRRAVGRYGFL